MLELKLTKESHFVNVLEAILDLTNVANVDCSSTGLKFQAVDPEDVAIIVLLFPAKDFQYYHCDKDISIGIPIHHMVKAIRCADKEDTITIKFGDENSGGITLSFESPKELANDLRFDFGLVDTNSRFQIPEWQDLVVECQASAPMPSVEFRRICKHLSYIGSGNGHISLAENVLNFYASGENGSLDINYMQPEEATSIDIASQARVSVTLDMKYLNYFAKLAALSDQVEIFFSKMHPLMLECKMGRMCQIIYLVAHQAIEIEEGIKSSKDEGSRKGKDRSKESEDDGEGEREENKSHRRRRRSRKRVKTKDEQETED